jgi:putative ABC transport system permease protein
MAVYSSERRAKEIGIRKVHGASTRQLMGLLNKDLMKWVIVAFAIACPIGWYAMNKWLQDFAYRTEISWWIFMFAGMVALIVALLTVSWQTWRTATRNPVESLRYE